MRSSAQIAEEIKQLEAEIARNNELGIQSRRTPEYRAARFDWLLNGNRSGLDAYSQSINTALQNRLSREATAQQNQLNRENALAIAQMSKAEAAAERKRKEDEIKALKLAQARPEYMKVQKQLLDAVDAGKLDDAAIYQEQLNALNAEHGIGVAHDIDDMRKTWDDALAAKKAKEAEENDRLYRVEKFRSTIPTNFRNEKAKNYWYEAISKNTDMLPKEKADEIKRVRETVSGQKKIKSKVEDKVAQNVVDDMDKAKKEREEGIALAKKAKEKKAKGYALRKSEQDALNKYGDEVK